MLGPMSKSADKNWLDLLASIVISPPGIAPAPLIDIGKLYRPPCSILIPSSSSALMTGPSGRSYERGSPSKAISPSARAASGGRKRITVPALPTSIVAGPLSGAGVTIQLPSFVSSIFTPRTCKPATINWLSREMRGLRIVDGFLAWAARISARLVTDFEPGIST